MAARLRRGEVRWFDFPPPDKRRPVLILTRDSGLGYLNRITVAPLTSTVRKADSQVILTPEDDGVAYLCAINLDHVQTVPIGDFGPILTRLSMARMIEVERALMFALGMDARLLL